MYTNYLSDTGGKFKIFAQGKAWILNPDTFSYR